MKHFYPLLAALVCTPLLAQKPAQLPQCVLSPQHELEYRQHMEKSLHEAKNPSMTVYQSENSSLKKMPMLLAQSSGTIMLCDYEEVYDKNNKLQSKKVYTYDESGNRTSVENYNYSFADGVIWEGEMTAGAWDASTLRFSDNEGYLPSLSNETYDMLVGKTMHLDIKNVAGESSTFRIMNGWWSATYYEFQAHSGETLDFLFTQQMCDECKDRDLTFMSTGSDITISKFYFDVDKDVSALPETKTEYTYDARGRQTGSVSYSKQDGKLVYTSKTEYAFDADGYQTLNADYYWENGAWVCRQKSEQLFDENGRPIGSIYINQYWSNSKQEYLFDDNGRQTGYLYYVGQEDQWTLDSKVEYIFNDNGIIAGTLSYSWKDEKWMLISKSESTIDENGRQTSATSYTMVDGEWVNSSKTEYTYNENGRQTCRTSYTWIDSEWVGSSKYENKYDENDYQIFVAYYNWVDGKWAATTEYTYDNHGSQTSYTSYSWVNGEHIATYQTKNEIEYNSFGRIVSSTGYHWNNVEWYGTGREEYTYDENHNISTYSMFSLNNNEWSLTKIYVYHYFPFEIKATSSITPVVEEGTEITEQNAEDISEFKMELNNVETFEVTENASAELFMNGVLTGTASKENISEENGVVTIKFKLLNDEATTRANFAALLSAQTRAASEDVKIEVKIAAGSFSINEEVVTEEIAFSYTAPATAVGAIEEALSIEGIAADETAAPAYTLQGIRANKEPKGLMIKNGKKLYVK